MSEDRKTRERFEKAVADHANVEILKQTNRAYSPGPTSHEPPPSYPSHTSTESTYVPAYVPPSLERERKPYATIPTESAIDDIVPPPPAQPQQKPLERERQPYTAQPGGGKTYEDDLRGRGDPIRPVRSNSSSSNARPVPVTLSQRAQGIPPQDPHRHQRGMSNAGTGRRYRSPSVGNDFRHSDGNLSYQPPYLSSEQSFEDRTADDLGLGRTRSARQGPPDPDMMRGYGESPRGGGGRYDRAGELGGQHRGSYGNEEDYYRSSGRGQGQGQGGGYDYSQPHGGQGYR